MEDWGAVRTNDEMMHWLFQRDTHAVEVIQREVLAKRRRALVIYGGLHFLRNPSQPEAPGIVVRLERAGAKVFSFWTNTYADLDALQADVLSWPKPSLAVLRGNRLGAEAFARYYPFEPLRISPQNGGDVPVERSTWRSLPAHEQFDAVLYVGPPSTITYSRMSRALCADAAYMKMRLQRISLVDGMMGRSKPTSSGGIVTCRSRLDKVARRRRLTVTRTP